MSPANRSVGRNVFIYYAESPAMVRGGLRLTKGVTNANFYSMVEIIFIFDRRYFLRFGDQHDIVVQKDNHLLQPGNYYIVTEGSITVSDEPWLVRTISVSTGTRVSAFREAVRERDRQCVITGEEVDEDDDWSGFAAARVFPLAYEGHWNENNYGRWITVPPAVASAGSINSVQNGMLLTADLHALFDNYHVSINPDDDFKIVCFKRDRKGVAGKHLNQQFLNDPRRPVDQLLRWHFRQAVLANMKGAGEPVFEVDFPPGSDIMGEIMSGPMAAKRMEFELFGRLAVQ